MSNKVITLFSSESTVRYIKDIFTVLALPRGSVYQFRYDTQYIDSELLDEFDQLKQDDNIHGLKALIAFRSKSQNTVETEMFYLPIRWASIISVATIANGYTVYFKLEGYPDYNQNFKTACTHFTTLNEAAKELFLRKYPHKDNYAIWPGQLPSVASYDDDKKRDSDLWFQVVSSLSKIPTYQEYQFVKCSNIYTKKLSDNQTVDKQYCSTKANCSILTEGKCAYIDIEYYSEKYDKNIVRELEVIVDDKVVRKSKGMYSNIESRYGEIRLGFQPQKTANHTISEIVIVSKSNKSQELATDIRFPIIVNKNTSFKAVKAIVTAVGGLFVALPGVLGSASDVWINIAFAVVGVGILGVNTYWDSKE